MTVLEFIKLESAKQYVLDNEKTTPGEDIFIVFYLNKCT